MKKSLLGAAAALALAAPGIASADTSGAIEMSIANHDFDFAEVDDYELGATLLHDLSSGMTLQGEGRTTLQSWDSGDWSHGYAAAHLSGEAGGWDWGGYAGLLNYFGDGGWMLGAEARTAFGNFSLDGSISYANMDDDTYDATAVRVGGAYFFSPSFALTGGAAWQGFDTVSQDWPVTEYSLGAAYQFANNITLFGGYTYTEGEPDITPDYEGDSLHVGLRFNFNGGSLQDDTNDGAWQSAARFADTWKRWL